ncbi:MAG: type III-B CRISPR module RAMP protein Cmr4 [Persicimonas sp.]
MNNAILGMLAETSVHPGAGRSTGFVDLPVAREAATDYPVIVGSSLKGALRDQARQSGWKENGRADKVFGVQDNAGDLLVSDARLLLLPVRSLNSHYKWVTCPHLIERYTRDRRRAGVEAKGLAEHKLNALANEHSALGFSTGETLFLEERQFTTVADIDRGVIDALASLFVHPEAAQRLERQLVVLRDDDFTWFARYGLSVNARNVLDEENKTSMNLWYEETIPPDSLFYTVLAERQPDALVAAQELFNQSPYVQVGGNATVGQGWFAVEWLDQGGVQ